jgi:hypothetical protein
MTEHPINEQWIVKYVEGSGSSYMNAIGYCGTQSFHLLVNTQIACNTADARSMGSMKAQLCVHIIIETTYDLSNGVALPA